MNKARTVTENMKLGKGVIYHDVKKSVDDVINYMGNDISFAMPLALGKPILFMNELYRRAKEDPSIRLNIVTALSLEQPKGKSDMEKRFMGPLISRVFAGVPVYDYMTDFSRGKLPKNIGLYEFYTKAGAFLHSPEGQRNHLNSNYAHVVRDAIDFGCNVHGQLLSCREIDGKMMYSMGCNTDIAIEGQRALREIRDKGGKVIIMGEVNPNLPFMYGEAVKDASSFDILLEGPEFHYQLFGPPNDAINTRDHAIALHVSTLVKDGGTLQIGIGALGDAISSSLAMRQNHNEEYNKTLKETGISDKYHDIITNLGGTEKFEEGLYGSSEMFVNGFLQLYKSGVLKRKVYDNVSIMRLINAGKLATDKIPSNIIELLIEDEGIYPRLREKDFNMLTKFGILKAGLEFKDGFIIDGKNKISADFYDKKNLSAIQAVLGKKLNQGQVILGAFFLGPRAFYNTLNAMSEEERMQFGMAGAEKVNQLYGDEELRSLQRKDGRFINTGMMVNALGAITSDQLEDGRVVSGIGGQYNFVSMAHALPDGRLIMMIKSTRGSGKNTRSNVIYKYGHTSIPRHLRDIVVTEYGIADLRGLQDSKIIEEILKITDSRFQDELIREAKKNGKLDPDYKLADEYRHNTPEKIAAMFKPYQAKGFFPAFPFGTDFTLEEIKIGASLKGLLVKSKSALIAGILSEMLKSIPSEAEPFLKRMDLLKPANGREKIMRKVLLFALRSSGAI